MFFGVLTGIAVDRLYMVRHFHKSFMGGPGMADRHKKMEQHILAQLTKKLNLSDAQAQQVKAIVEQSGQEVKQVRDGFRANLMEVRKKTFDRISVLLNPEQKSELEKMIKEHRFFGHGIGLEKRGR